MLFREGSFGLEICKPLIFGVKLIVNADNSFVERHKLIGVQDGIHLFVIKMKSLEREASLIGVIEFYRTAFG